MKLNELLQSDHFEEKEEICQGLPKPLPGARLFVCEWAPVRLRQ